MTLDRAAIAALLPHAGAMCLLDGVLAWDAREILCTARSHLDPEHPLRRDGELPTLCGLEYALQAAALHGALTDDGTPQAPGYVAMLRDVVLHVMRLDDPGFGVLRITARLEHGGPAGARYGFGLATVDGRPLLEGRATIAFGAG